MKLSAARVTQLIKIVLVLVPVFLLWSILNDNFIFTKSISFHYRPGQRGNGVIRPDRSSILRTDDPTLPWRLASASTKINIHIPRLIDQIRLRLRLQPAAQPYVWLSAVLSNGTSLAQRLIFAQNLELLSWPHQTTGPLTLWQRNTADIPVTAEKTDQRPIPKQFPSIENFLQHPPAVTSVGEVGLDPFALTSIPNYHPVTTTQTIHHDLRGSHDFYVYAANENLTWSFSKVDLNRVRGKDTLLLYVGRVDQVRSSGTSWLKVLSIPDDGVSQATNQQGHGQQVTLSIPNVSAGLYLIRIVTSDEVLLRDISTTQHLVTTQRLVLADGPAYRPGASFTPIEMMTNGPALTLSANHNEGRQNVFINSATYRLTQSKKSVTTAQLRGQTAFTITKGDVVVSTSGLLTLSPFDLFSGEHMVALDVSAPLLPAQLDYVIGDYHLLGAQTILDVQQTYALRDLQLSGTDGKLVSFSVDAPGAAGNGRLGLRQIDAQLERGPFPWNKIWSKISPGR